MRPEPAGIFVNPTGSCDGKQFVASGHGFAVFKTVGQHAQSERFDFSQCVRLGRSVSHAARQFHDLGNPAAILLVLNFDLQVHGLKLVHLSEAVELKTTVHPGGQFSFRQKPAGPRNAPELLQRERDGHPRGHQAAGRGIAGLDELAVALSSLTTSTIQEAHSSYLARDGCLMD